MLDVTYICNRQRPCSKKMSCGYECTQTTNPEFAKNQRTLELIAELYSTFEIQGNVRLIERVKDETMA